MNLDFIDYENDEVFHNYIYQIMSELQKKYDINLKDKKIIRRLARLCRE